MRSPETMASDTPMILYEAGAGECEPPAEVVWEAEAEAVAEAIDEDILFVRRGLGFIREGEMVSKRVRVDGCVS